MKLSELKTGEKAVIVKVSGHGGFRKRIIEMGFVKGKTVEVLLNAPLHDPVKYRIMGYEVSLRHSEAERIEVVAEQTVREDNANENEELTLNIPETKLYSEALKKRRTINVALVGNPNCGKTSLFNFVSGAHERVGNYSGVTVDAKEGTANFKGYTFNIVDLPGTYSLSAYSPEELYVRQHIIDNTPDIIINVIDSSNLERNLYLTTQLIDMNLRIVGALNMYDELQGRGDKLDIRNLGELLGFPLVPTVFRDGRGVDDLFTTIIQVYEGTYKKHPLRHIHINYGHEIENGISDMQEHLKSYSDIRERFSTRYLAIKLLEHDQDIEKTLSSLPDYNEIILHRNDAARRIEEELKTDSETAIMDAKYGFIRGALQETGYKEGNEKDTYEMTHRLDKIITHKWLGFPLFFVFLFVMFEATFALGQYPMDLIDYGVELLSE